MQLGINRGIDYQNRINGKRTNIQFLHNGFTAPDTLTTGALYVTDNLGVLRTAGVDKLVIPGARLSGSDFVLTDTEGAQIFTSASVRTKSQGSVTQYTDADWQGMLVMPARTNKVTYSEQFDNASWAKVNVAITANAIAGPEGLTTADKIQVNTTSGAHGVAKVTLVSSGTHALSMFAKAGEINWCVLGDGQQTGVYFDLANGTIGTVSPAFFSPTITPLANGWYYLTTVFTAIAGSGLATYAANGDGGILFAGANTTDGFYAIGAQLEAGAFSTPYIPTTTATVTRAATVDSFTSANRLRANDMGGRVHVIPSAAGQTGWLFNSYTGAVAEFGLLANPTTLVLRNRNASVDTDLTLSYTHVADREFEVDWLKLTTGMHIRVREKISGTWQAWSAWSDLTSAGAQADATIAATYQYARNGANQFAASRPNFYTMFNATKAKLEAL